MTLYIPDFEPQHDEGLEPPLTNCNPASNAMLIDWWTYGAIDTSDVLLRQASGISVKVGMNFAAVDRAIRALFGKQLGSLLYSESDGSGSRNWVWRQLTDHLAAGGGAVVCGFYKDLPTRLRRWSPVFTGGHAAYVQGISATERLWFDPLAKGDASYGGEPISLDELWGFIWTAGSSDATRNYITAAHGFTAPRPTRSLFPDVLPGKWYTPAIERLARANILGGYRDGTFRPDAPMTRAEVAVLIDRLREGQS